MEFTFKDPAKGGGWEETVIQSKRECSFCFVLGVEDWIQGLGYARQVLYQRAVFLALQKM